MASLQDLGGSADKVLQLFAKHLKLRGVEVPDRVYVAAGQQVPWDGEQLVVNLQSIEQGQPGIPVSGSYMPPSALNLMAQWSVSLVRELPSIEDGPMPVRIPSADELETAGTNSMDDAAALVLAASDIYSEYSLTGPGEGFEIGPLMTLGPEGGLTGSRILVTVSLV